MDLGDCTGGLARLIDFRFLHLRKRATKWRGLGVICRDGEGLWGSGAGLGCRDRGWDDWCGITAGPPVLPTRGRLHSLQIDEFGGIAQSAAG